MTPRFWHRPFRAVRCWRKIPIPNYRRRVKLKIGPVSAKFTGTVTLSDIQPPHAYVISGSGKGGVAGGATGSAKVTLEEIEGGTATRLSYEVEAAVTGKIAQLGSRLIESTAKKLAGKFFDDFVAILSPEKSAT